MKHVAWWFKTCCKESTTPRPFPPRFSCRAKGWFTYKRDNDNSNFVPVVLCASESGRGLEEVSPAHFEVHRAMCAQKKWRQSFKVLGACCWIFVGTFMADLVATVARGMGFLWGGGGECVCTCVYVCARHTREQHPQPLRLMLFLSCVAPTYVYATCVPLLLLLQALRSCTR